MASFNSKIATQRGPFREIEEGGSRDIDNISRAPPFDFHFSSRPGKKSGITELKEKNEQKTIPNLMRTAVKAVLTPPSCPASILEAF